MQTFEEHCAAASEAAMADAFRAAFEPPARPMQPQHMTADEHASALHHAVRDGRQVQYRNHGLTVTKSAADFVQEHAYDSDEVNKLSLAADRIEALGGSDKEVADAFRKFRRAAVDYAGLQANIIERESGSFLYRPLRSLRRLFFGSQA
ncbi:MAG: hypothetical protein KER_03052 [Kerstersia gyiorum]|uniref:hypothetical protein n=1 Tax=Kerstersia gyiorum TaxID=206506 RepID=UPI0030D31A10